MSRHPAAWIPLLLALSVPAGAVVITVDTTNDEVSPFSYNGQCSLREAIQAANTDTAVDSCPAGSGADTILVPAGTYLLELDGVGEDANQTGDLDVTEDVEIVGDGAALTVIDQETIDRVFHLRCDAGAPATVTVTIRDLMVTGGGVHEEAGGGVFIEGCASPVHATLERLEVSNNFADYRVSDPALARPGGGIGIDSAGLVTIRDSLIRNNSFVQEDDFGSLGGGGVGIFDEGTLVIEDSHFLNNGALEFSGYRPSGAAVWTGTFTEIRGSTFEGNSTITGGRGGALYCEDAVLRVENSTLIGNQAARGGGGFGNGVDGAPGCLVFFESVTITGNTANSTGGGGILNATGGVSVTNSIVADNQGPGLVPEDVSGTFTSGDYNLIGVIDGSSGFTEPNDLSGTSASPLDPGLGVLGDEGFAVPTIAPLAGSPALNNGGGTTLTLDQRGLPRGSFGIAPERGAAEVLNANTGIYLDVGTYGGSPSGSYAAAATAPGTWNAFGIGSFPATERSGASSPVTLEVSSQSDGGISAGSTDAARLFGDDARDCGLSGDWSVEFDGLEDADYLVLIYSPLHDDRSTGDILVDGAPLAPLPGDTTALLAGVSFAFAEASVTGGNLLVSGNENSTPDCAGIAGVQVLPEPGRNGVLSLACLLLASLARHGRRAG